MLVYVIATILSVGFTYISVQYNQMLQKSNKKKRYRYIKNVIDTKQRFTLKLFQVCSVLPLVCVAGFRYRVGRDWLSYKRSFESVANGKMGYYGEWGYILLQKVIALFTHKYVWLFLICAVIFAYFYFAGFYKMSINPSLSVALLVCTSLFFSFMNGMRQGLALSILFFSLEAVFERDFRKFFLLVVLAMGFHTSSIVFLIIYPLYNIEIDEQQVVKYCLIFGIFSLFGGKIVRWVIMKTKYAHYYTSVFAEEGFELNWFLISMSILIVMCIYYKTAVQREDYSRFRVLLWMQLLSVIFCLLSACIPVANRIIWMFNIGQLLSLPMVISYEKDRGWRILLSVLIVGFYALATTIAITGGSHRVLPYRTCFGYM